MPQYFDDIAVFGDPVDQGALLQIKNCREDAQHAALMGDHHKGYGCPIGGVVAYKDAIAPGSVGFDIACGNKAVRLDITNDDIRNDLTKIADEIWQALSFGIGRTNSETPDHPLFDSPTWKDVSFLKTTQLKALAQNQLGTIGSGNHYCDVFKDEKNRIWIGVHFGSRGFGHKVASEFIRLSGGNPNGGMDEKPTLLNTNTPEGEDYIQAMSLAGEYAYAGRDWVCQKVAQILGANIQEEIHNHHNFAWKENHFGEDLWVVRKGATPAFPNQKGFVGGSMGDQSVILEGKESKDSAKALYSTVHGAGRVMSRTQSAGKVRFKEGKKIQLSQGQVDFDAVKKRIASQGIILKGAGADEAPEVYKRLPEVLAHQGDTIKVLHRLDPLIVCMAGSDEFDPYKD